MAEVSVSSSQPVPSPGEVDRKGPNQAALLTFKGMLFLRDRRQIRHDQFDAFVPRIEDSAPMWPLLTAVM